MRAALIIVWALWEGCDTPPPPVPKVVQFEVTPTTVCPGGKVTVTWKIEDGTPILYESSIDLLQKAADETLSDLYLLDDNGVIQMAGSKQLVVTKNMSLKAASFLDNDRYDTSEAILVTVAESTGVVAMSFKSCVGSGWGSDSVDGVWTSQAKITNVASDTLDRSIELTHAGHTWALAQGGASNTVPADQTLNGPWSASATLKSGEGCGSGPSLEGSNPIPTKPPALKARVQWACP